jgi:hypothetical protein
MTTPGERAERKNQVMGKAPQAGGLTQTGHEVTVAMRRERARSLRAGGAHGLRGYDPEAIAPKTLGPHAARQLK